MKPLVPSLHDSILGSGTYRQIQRMEEAQQIWAKNFQPLNTLSEQLRSLTEPVGGVAKIAIEFERAEKQRLDQIRAMLGPIEDVRKSLIADSNYRKLIEEIERPSFMSAELERIAKEARSFDYVAKAMQASVQDSFSHAQEMLAAASISGSLAQTFNVFKEAERHWSVPTELVNSIGALKAMQEQFGKLTLPVVDFASASTLAKLLGPEGIEAQLAALGIAADGALIEEDFAPENGGVGLSRKTLDLMALLSFILAVLVPIYQELSSREWQKQTDEKLEAQAKQLESLSHLVEKALVQEARRNEQRFVVLDRITMVRRKPEHGSVVEGKLFPREVVRPISEQGKWIQFEYYHWLLQSYQTGWALKKYFKRIPASSGDNSASSPGETK